MPLAFVVGVCLLALVAMGVCFAVVSAPDPSLDLREGTYATISEAERATGRAIPHARDTGRFGLHAVEVSAGSDRPVPPSEPWLDRTAFTGGTNGQWIISLRYRGASPAEYVNVHISPKAEVAPLVGLGPAGEALVGEHRALLQHIGPDRPEAVLLQWMDGLAFLATAPVESPASGAPGVAFEEVLRLLGSIR